MVSVMGFPLAASTPLSSRTASQASNRAVLARSRLMGLLGFPIGTVAVVFISFLLSRWPARDLPRQLCQERVPLRDDRAGS